jgi:hypothetical protein
MTSVASEVEALKLQLKEKDRVIVRLKARLRQVGDAAHFLGDAYTIRKHSLGT